MSPERLERIAESVADERPVDWAAEIDDTDVGRRIANLRVLERIGVIHRDPLGYDSTRMMDDTSPSPGPGARDAAPSATGTATAGPDGTNRWGSLELVEVIGHGGCGEVFRAYDPDLRTDVALKILRDCGTDPKVLLREAQGLARVRHPNVVVVHGARVRDGRVGIWMELVRGRTLEQCLDERGPFGPREAAAIGVEILKALAAVHAAGLVHRDIKAANVIRENGGRVVLMDFSTTVEARRLQALSDHEAFVGTARYMAPEVFEGHASGVPADLYAVGVVLYRLVTGRYPVDASSPRELRDRHRRGEIVPLRDVRPDVPVEFLNVVETALARDPAHRYRSAGEMERALAASVGAEPRHAGATRWMRPAMVGAALALVAVGAWRMGRPAALQVTASLLRTRDATEELLGNGGAVRPGDLLNLEITGTRDVWAYVLDEDDAGHVSLLFPLSGVDARNPLSAGVAHRLPGRIDGASHSWAVTTAGGRERVYVIASTRRLESLEKTIADVPEASAGVPVEVTPDALDPVARRVRGIGGVVKSAGEDDERGPTPLGRAFEQLSRGTDRDGMWTWLVELENPVP